MDGAESIRFFYTGPEQDILPSYTMPLSFNTSKVTMEGAPVPLYAFEVQSYWSVLA